MLSDRKKDGATRACRGAETTIPRRISIATTVFPLSILLSLFLSALAFATPASRAESSQLNFDVFLDERPIGYQRFELHQDSDGLRIETRAEFAVTLLRIKAFAYDHRNVEQWRDGCLQSIASQTESNGKPYRVTGSSGPNGFAVTSGVGSQLLTDCVGTFSYWDKRQLLGHSKLLNAQTGEYLAVESQPLGPGTLTLGNRELAVERFVLKGKDLEITLAYSLESGEWVALDSPLFAGFTLRYRRRHAAELGPSEAHTSLEAPSPALR